MKTKIEVRYTTEDGRSHTEEFELEAESWLAPKKVVSIDKVFVCGTDISRDCSPEVEIDRSGVERW